MIVCDSVLLPDETDDRIRNQRSEFEIIGEALGRLTLADPVMWGIRPIPDEERLDLSHYPEEFVEFWNSRQTVVGHVEV